MDKCAGCGKEFSFSDRIKSLRSLGNKVHCSNCGVISIRKSKTISSINIIISVFLGLCIFLFILKGQFNNKILEILVAVIIVVSMEDFLSFLTIGIGDRIVGGKK